MKHKISVMSEFEVLGVLPSVVFDSIFEEKTPWSEVYYKIDQKLRPIFFGGIRNIIIQQLKEEINIPRISKKTKKIK